MKEWVIYPLSRGERNHEPSKSIAQAAYSRNTAHMALKQCYLVTFREVTETPECAQKVNDVTLEVRPRPQIFD